MIRTAYRTVLSLLPQSASNDIQRRVSHVMQALRSAAPRAATKSLEASVPPPARISYRPKASFADASRDAGIGYLNPDLVVGHPDRAASPDLTLTPDHVAALLASVAIGANRHKGDVFRVLDVGGADGGLREYVRAALDMRDKQLEWTIIETELYVDLARRIGNRGISYFTSIDQAKGPFDFVLFSGVLQYLEDWRSPLRHPVVTATEHILISRTSMGDEEIAFLQTVAYPDKTVRYPGRILRLTDVEALLTPSHDRFIGWDFSHHMIELGINAAPAMLWRRRPNLAKA